MGQPATKTLPEPGIEDLLDLEHAKLPAAARDVLWLVTCAEDEIFPPSNFEAMVAAISTGRGGGGMDLGWHVVHRTGRAGGASEAASVAPRAFAAAGKARRIARALERTYGVGWRNVALEIAGWLLEAKRLPALGIAAGAAPRTRAAQVGWTRYVQATRVPSARAPQTMREWLVRLNERACSGRHIEVKLAKEVAREAEQVLHAALAQLGRTR